MRATMIVKEAMRATAERRLRELASVDRVAARRLVFASVHGLSADEVEHLDQRFDPGPEYDA
jgi:hypothetical protein